MKPVRISLSKWMMDGLLVIGLALLAGGLTACGSTSGGAPVSSRTAEHKVVKSAGYYKVRPGDTLYAIAWRQGLDYHRLAAWNGIRGPKYRIYPGQRLHLTRPPNRNVAPTKPKKSPSQPKVTPAKKRVKVEPTVPKQAKTGTAPKIGKESVKLSWRWPTKGRVVQTYSSRDRNRKGIRISGHPGQPVKAAEAGRVVYSGSGLVGYGNLIIVKHNNNYLSAYGYNRKLLVKEGDKVAGGDRIADMGSPRKGAEPLLHFEIRKQGKPVNPLGLLPRNR